MEKDKVREINFNHMYTDISLKAQLYVVPVNLFIGSYMGNMHKIATTIKWKAV